VNPRRIGRTEPMGRRDWQKRALDARGFQTLAALGWDEPSVAQQAAANAVNAAIAAADAICGKELRERYRGQDHRGTSALLRQVAGSEPAARAFDTLISQKDAASYSTAVMGPTTLLAMRRALDSLMTFMDEVLAQP
jgi:hypothetical protein